MEKPEKLVLLDRREFYEDEKKAFKVVRMVNTVDYRIDQDLSEQDVRDALFLNKMTIEIIGNK